jgi:spoIIIJ-associated protein
MIDVSGYRRKRAEALTRFVRQVAEEVAASGTPKALEPMSPADRKTVHDALTDVAGVATVSEGDAEQRHVVIVPDPA